MVILGQGECSIKCRIKNYGWVYYKGQCVWLLWRVLNTRATLDSEFVAVVDVVDLHSNRAGIKYDDG